MCAKTLPAGQKCPTLGDCYHCSAKDKEPVADANGNCPHDQYRERYFDPTEEAYAVEVKSA